jgi:hypothetical protein
MITIQVFYKSSGKPADGKRVKVFFEGSLRGQSEAFTNSNGDAHFDVDPGTATVYVSGDRVYHGQVAGRTIVYV